MPVDDAGFGGVEGGGEWEGGEEGEQEGEEVSVVVRSHG